MHDSDVYEVIHLNCEIQGPWNRGSGPGAGPVLPYSKIHYIFINSFLYSHIYLRKTIYKVMIDVHGIFYLNFKIYIPWVRGSGPRARPIFHIHVVSQYCNIVKYITVAWLVWSTVSTCLQLFSESQFFKTFFFHCKSRQPQHCVCAATFPEIVLKHLVIHFSKY